MSNKDEIRVLTIAIGILDALKQGTINIEFAEKNIFAPKYVKELKEKKCNGEIIKIIEEGCELEDIESLVPQKLANNIEILEKKALELLKMYEF